MKRIVLSATPLILAACMGNGAGAPPVAPDAACDARPATRFVGMPFAAKLAEQARSAAQARTVRIIRPGQAVTMDVRGDRLNMELDEQDRISAVRCG